MPNANAIGTPANTVAATRPTKKISRSTARSATRFASSKSSSACRCSCVRAGKSPDPAAGRLMQSLQQAFELIGDACDELRDPSSLAVLRLAVTAKLAESG